jgi:hypothetical protein
MKKMNHDEIIDLASIDFSMLTLSDDDAEMDEATISTIMMQLGPESFVFEDTNDKKKKRIKDPSDPRAIFAPNEIDATVGGELPKTDRRNANKKPPSRACLNETERKRFSKSMYVDSMTIPTVTVYDEELLDTSRISLELARSGSEARSLSTIVFSRDSLAASICFGMYEAFEMKISETLDSPAKMAMLFNLVGHLLPVFGQMRKPPSTGLGPRSKIYQNHSPINDEYHSFAFEPVVIATSGEGIGDPGEIVAQGVVVSNKGLNFPAGDARRLTLGRKDEFEESLCWVLITHVYFPYITYASIGPHKTRKVTDNVYQLNYSEHNNLYDSVFRWDDYMNSHTHLKACGVSSFGFTDTKQTGKDIARRLFPWSVEYARDTLEWFRSRGKMEEFLLETDMSSGRRAKDREDVPSGMDMRRFLLMELLLTNTPLEKMLTGEPVFFDFKSPNIKGGARGLYDRLSNYSYRQNTS